MGLRPIPLIGERGGGERYSIGGNAEAGNPACAPAEGNTRMMGMRKLLPPHAELAVGRSGSKCSLMLRRPHARRYTRMMGRQNLPVLHAKPHPIDRMAYPVRPAHEAGSQFGRQQMRSRFLSTRLMGQRSLSILAHAAGGQFARNTCSHSLLPMAQSLLAHCPAISFMGFGGVPPCSPSPLSQTQFSRTKRAALMHRSSVFFHCEGVWGFSAPEWKECRICQSRTRR